MFIVPVLFQLIVCNMSYSLSVRTSLVSKTFTKVELFGREMYLKRDDQQFHLSGLNGNKGRKMSNILELNNFSSLASIGGVQSNSLLALSKIAKFKGLKLSYICNKVPNGLKKNPIGNYKLALELDTMMLEVSPSIYRSIAEWSEAGADPTKYDTLLFPILQSPSLVGTRWVRQGGAMPEAKDGIFKLGEEISAFVQSNDLPGPWKVIVASGTGTTAYFLARYFADYPTSSTGKRIEVVAAPCVGTAQYLAKQMDALDALYEESAVRPTILSNTRIPKRIFAKPDVVHLRLWREIQEQTGINFDLIYAPRTMEILLSMCSGADTTGKILSLASLMPGSNIIYYHCGGVEGNESQLSRYDITEEGL